MPDHATGTAKNPAAQLSGRVNIRVTENVTLENLHTIVERIVHMTGCTGCGLLGVDLRLAGDPETFQQIGKIPGVQSASFGE